MSPQKGYGAVLLGLTDCGRLMVTNIVGHAPEISSREGNPSTVQTITSQCCPKPFMDSRWEQHCANFKFETVPKNNP
jgi:hypothetical protein